MSEVNYEFLAQIAQLLLNARKTVKANVNLTMVYTYYEIGRRIIVEEQSGSNRTEYGKQVLKGIYSERSTWGLAPINLLCKVRASLDCIQSRSFAILQPTKGPLCKESASPCIPERELRLSSCASLQVLNSYHLIQ